MKYFSFYLSNMLIIYMLLKRPRPPPPMAFAI